MNKWCAPRILAITAGLLLFSSPGRGAEIAINGFGNLYGAQALNAHLLPIGFTNKNVDLTHFSSIGINLSTDISNDITFAAQFIATGGNAIATNFSTFAQWAFVNYTPTDGTSIRLGRQLFPLWLPSEYIGVHYLLPYREMPAVVYALGPFKAFDGVAITQRFGDFSAEIFGGSPFLDATSLNGASMSNLFGAQLVLVGDGWKIRAMASKHYITATIGTVVADGHTESYTAGYRFDKYNFVSWGEYGLFQTPDGTQMSNGRLIGHGATGYILTGYHIGKFLPRYTFSKSVVNYGFPRQATDVHTIGVNYEIAPRASLKFDYDAIFVPDAGQSVNMTQLPATKDKRASAVYAGMDFIF